MMKPKTYTATRSFDKVSISRIKRSLADVTYYTDDLVFSAITAQYNPSELAAKSVDGFSAIIMLSGEATIQLNTKSYTIRPNTIVFLAPNSIIRTEHSTANAAGYFLAFSKSFLNKIHMGLTSSLPLLMHFRKSPVLKLQENEVGEILGIFQLMKRLLAGKIDQFRTEIVHSLFKTAFYLIADISNREKESRPKQGRCEVIFDDFMELLEQHCRRERNVSFYAEQLNITPKYFSSAIKEVSGKPAARWIDEAVILEAQTMLRYSEMSIQEIANALNFSTQSFFGKYFKQHTGVSPSRYKHK